MMHRCNVATVILLSLATAGCISSAPSGRVLRVEYREAPGTDPIEPGVIFWRRQPVRGDEIPADLLEKLGQSFPMTLLLDEKLANTCYYTASGFGLALLEREPSRLSGPLWLTADYTWSVDFTLAGDGIAIGSMKYSSSKTPYPLAGTHREVSDFSECYEQVRLRTGKGGEG
jgi:hypothetical protein